MKRYLSSKEFQNVSNDFRFLFKEIRKSLGEIDFRLRNGSFNLYNKGNSIASVVVQQKKYVVSINEKFATDNVFRDDIRFLGKGIKKNTYIEFQLTSDLVHPFFQKIYLDRIISNISKVNYSEELTFEQILISDNLNRNDFFIIDRQVTAPGFEGQLDLLGLRQQKGNQYQIEVIEVKLGKNQDLCSDVVDQLNGYILQINDQFESWKEGYEETYRQMKLLDLFDLPTYETIEIVPGIKGLIAVGWYSGEARRSIEYLTPRLGDYELKHFLNIL